MATEQPPQAAVDTGQRIMEIMSEQWQVDRKVIARETLLTEHTDSLGAVELIMALEDEFEQSIPDEEAERLRTVGDVIDYITRHAAAKIAADAGPAADNAAAPPGK